MANVQQLSPARESGERRTHGAHEQGIQPLVEHHPLYGTVIPRCSMTADEIFAEAAARGLCTAAQAAEAGHPVAEEGRRRRHIHWANSSDPDVRAAFEAGRMDGLYEYDRALVAALSFSLGNEKTTTIRDAADWHLKTVKQAERRRRGDARDPELLAEVERDTRLAQAASARRQRDLLARISHSRPIAGWEAWRDYCSPSVWARICAEYEAAGQPIPLSQAQTHRRLRAAA